MHTIYLISYLDTMCTSRVSLLPLKALITIVVPLVYSFFSYCGRRDIDENKGVIQLAGASLKFYANGSLVESKQLINHKYNDNLHHYFQSAESTHHCSL